MKGLKRHELPVVPTANLVDIAILLIIFYMACSNFVSKSQLKVKEPSAPDLTVQKEPLTMVGIDAAGVIYVQGRPVQNADAVEAGISSIIGEKTSDEVRTVLFKCDQSVSREIYEPVLQAIAAAGGIIMATGENIRKP